MPDYANGKICYIEIPAIDIDASAAFYKAVFGWKSENVETAVLLLTTRLAR